MACSCKASSGNRQPAAVKQVVKKTLTPEQARARQARLTSALASSRPKNVVRRPI